jgi:hypothetical protein
VPSPSLPARSQVIGSIALSLSAARYPQFQSWFDAIEASRGFRIVQYSGLTGSSSGVSFSAELDVTGAEHSSRLSQFEEIRP